RWIGPSQGINFFTLELVPKDPDEILAATVLNRLAYGPTPDELARVKKIGVDAYIQEQLAPETIEESLEIDKVTTGDDWQYVTLTAPADTAKIYLYLTGAGDCYVDDLKIVRGSVPEAG